MRRFPGIVPRPRGPRHSYPAADPIRSAAQVERLVVPDPRESVPYVFEILRTLRAELEGPRIPLLGFAGAPLTLAAYMVRSIIWLSTAAWR